MMKQEPSEHVNITSVSENHRLESTDTQLPPTNQFSNLKLQPKKILPKFTSSASAPTTSRKQMTTDVCNTGRNHREIVKFGELDILFQTINPFNKNRAIYGNSAVPRDRLHVAHQRVLLPAHTIPRTPINSNILPSGPAQSGFGSFSSKSLRPTVSFLMRIGSELISSQYASSINPKHKSRKRKADGTELGLHNSSSIDINHLTWKRKAYNRKWLGTQSPCRRYHCPYVPTSSLQLLRHLEVGHQKFVNIDTLHTLTYPLGKMTTVPHDNIHFVCGSDIGDQLMNEFFVPLVSVVQLSGFQLMKSCTVCNYTAKSWVDLLTHVAVCHPYLSLQPIEKPKLNTCSVCGHVEQNTNYTVAKNRRSITLHDSCKLNSEAYQRASWSACDAHPLACLMLYPTHYACFALPFSVAEFLYTLTEHMIVMRSAQFGDSSLESYTLRCCAAISVVFGHLVDVNSIKPISSYPYLEKYIKGNNNNMSLSKTANQNSSHLRQILCSHNQNKN